MADADIHEQACFVCQQRLEFFGPWQTYRYFLCVACKSIQLVPMPTSAELELAYRRQYLEQNEMEKSFTPEQWLKASLTYQQAILATAQKHRITGPLLDFGAGYGFLVDLMSRHGIATFGLELSEPKLAYCRSQGRDVREGGFEALERLKGSYAGVLMIAVFEHLSGHRDFLQRLHASLPDEGVFITLHPTSGIFRLLGWLMRFGNRKRELPVLDGSFEAPWHTALISVSGMRRLARETGFVVEDVQPAPQGRMDGLAGLIQILLESLNRVGWRLAGERWPLVTSHIFVLRKRGSHG